MLAVIDVEVEQLNHIVYLEALLMGEPCVRPFVHLRLQQHNHNDKVK